MDGLIRSHFENQIKAPDITFYLNISAEQAAERRRKRGKGNEKFEEIEFAKRLAKRYDELYGESKKEGDLQRLLGRRIVKIDAMQPIESITGDIVRILKPFYDSKT